MSEIHVDKERAFLVLDTLMSVKNQGQHPYENLAARLPQTQVAEEIRADPLTHARFLFYSCHYMRGAIKSDMAMGKLVKLFYERPEFFNPWHAARIDDKALIETLGRLIRYHADKIPLYWKENSRRMTRRWGGDPRKIFEGISGKQDVYRRVVNNSSKGRHSGFIGFRKKMTEMLTYFLVDANLVEEVKLSPPIDFHNLRILLATKSICFGEIDGKRYTQELVEVASELLWSYCIERGVSQVDLADATWVFSNTLCTKAIGNQANTTPDWSRQKDVDKYIRSCGACPIQAKCDYNVPASTYYKTGVLTRIERQSPDILFEHLPIQKNSPGG